MEQLHPESIESIKAIRRIAGQKRIVFVSGKFNILHPGHFRLLRFAKECGDVLVVGVYDSKNKDAHIHESLRLEGVRSISWVNFAFILHDEPHVFIKELRPHIVVKGKEHEDHENPEAKLVSAYGGKLLFGSGDVVFSSIDLMRKEWKELNVSTIKKPIEYQQRHNFSLLDLEKIFERIKNLRVGVIGDIIIDEYITCDPLGMSQEDPTIVVTPVETQKFVGGAGIVASHARGLGSSVHFFSVIGRDEAAQFARSKMENYKVAVHLYEDESRPTTLKQRYRASGKTLLRVSHLRQHVISTAIRKQIIDDFNGIIDDIDLMIFSDFSYGCLSQPLIEEIQNACVRRNIMMVADSQCSSQVGDISRFKNMMLITPTEREARIALHDFQSGLVVLAERFKQQSIARNVIITLGAEGILIQPEINDRNLWETDQLPALNSAPKDVAGAGDSLLTTTSMAMAAGAGIWESAYLGSLAAACQVGKLGNIPLTITELKAELSQ